MATIKYYTYQGGIYVEDAEGSLVGIEWQDASMNSVRAVLFFMDFSTLQYGREINLIYQVEIRPVGSANWLLSDRKQFKITNDILVVPSVDFSMMFSPRSADPEHPDATGQLDLFIGLYLRGDIPPPPTGLPPMYVWLAEIIADLEDQTL